MLENYIKLAKECADFFTDTNYFRKFNDNLLSSLTYIPNNLKGFNKNLTSLSVAEKGKTGNEVVFGSFNGLEMIDLISTIILFLAAIQAKQLLSKSLRSSPLLVKLGLRKRDREKLDECIWRLMFYAFSSCWLVYSCFIKHQSQQFLNPNLFFRDYTFNFDWDEYVICIIEVSFYLHAIYAIMFEDEWRRDSPAVLVHHLVAIVSFIIIYSTRTHRLGLLAVALRDTCDVILELGKLIMSLRYQHGKLVYSLDRLLKLCMVIFLLCFMVNQLYFYPLFCIYHGLNMIKVHRLQSPAMTVIMTCGILFFILDCFWFLLVMRLLYRMIFLNKPITDVREYDHEKEEKELLCSNRENASKLIRKKVD